MMAAYEAFSREVKQAGVFLGGEGLQPTATATTVRVRDGEPLLTDGPFAETREQLGGFYLLECADLDEAIALGGARSPAPRRARVEVRPVMDYEAPGAEAAGQRRGGARLSASRTTWTACSGASRRRRSRRSPARSATSTAPRRPSRTPTRPRSSAGRATACPRTRRRGSSPSARNRALDRIRAERRSAARAEEVARLDALAHGRRRATEDEDAREPDRRRAAAADLHVLPPGARAGGARRADAAAARRADDRRGGARVPGLGGRDGAARRARQGEDPRAPGSPTRCRATPTCRRGSAPCWRRSTSSSTRATPRRPATR